MLCPSTAGMSYREASVIAVLMNTRGLVEIIVLNLGIQSGILNSKVAQSLFSLTFSLTFSSTPRFLL